MRIDDFLQRAGGLDILVQVSQQPRSFGELEEALTVSTSTLNERLKDARKLDLIKKEIDEERDPRSDVVYSLTDTGRTVCDELPFDIDDYTDLQKKIKQKKKELEELKDRLGDYQEDGATAVVDISDSEIKSGGDVNINASSR